MEDGIPQNVIAKSLPVIGQHLANIFNSSLSSGVFPETRKRAHLMPLKKTAIPSATSDLGPIVVLRLLSKGLENIIHEQISEFIESSRVLDSR